MWQCVKVGTTWDLWTWRKAASRRFLIIWTITRTQVAWWRFLHLPFEVDFVESGYGWINTTLSLLRNDLHEVDALGWPSWGWCSGMTFMRLMLWDDLHEVDALGWPSWGWSWIFWVCWYLFYSLLITDFETLKVFYIWNMSIAHCSAYAASQIQTIKMTKNKQITTV